MWSSFKKVEIGTIELKEYLCNNSIAEIIILVRTLPVDVVPCGAGRFLHSKLVIFKVIFIFLDRIDLMKPRMTWKTYFTMKTQALGLFKSSVCPPLAACDIYGRPRSKILLSAIVQFDWSAAQIFTENFETDSFQLFLLHLFMNGHHNQANPKIIFWGLCI